MDLLSCHFHFTLRSCFREHGIKADVLFIYWLFVNFLFQCVVTGAGFKGCWDHCWRNGNYYWLKEKLVCFFELISSLL